MTDFAVVEGKIRFGLTAVKNVGDAAAQAIVRGRKEDGPFKHVWDLVERVSLQVMNKRALESLFYVGALDSLGHSRKALVENIDAILSYGQRLQADRLLGQANLFDLGGESSDAGLSRPYLDLPKEEYEKQELLRGEREFLGLYVSEHPLSSVRDQLRKKTDASLAEIERRRDGETVTVGGIVSEVKQVTTKRGEPMVFLTLDDPTGSAEVVVFNSTYASSRELCAADRILVVKGRVDHKQQGETKLIALEVTAFEAVSERRDVRLQIDATRARAGIIGELKALFEDFPGECPVYLDLRTSSGPKTLFLGSHRVRPEPDLFAEAKALLGEAAVL